jgi:5-methylcytosine-specific restriction enzyme A
MPRRAPKYRPASPKRRKDDRPSSSKRGYDSRWRRARKRKLADNPLCQRCLANGRSVIAHQVDHIDPVDGRDDPTFWDPTNWQSLCDSCHSKKTVNENGGFGRERMPGLAERSESIDFKFEISDRKKNRKHDGETRS